MIWKRGLPSSIAIASSLRTPGARAVCGPSMIMKSSARLIARQALDSHVGSGAASLRDRSVISKGESGKLDCATMKSFRTRSLSKSKLTNSPFFMPSLSILVEPTDRIDQTREILPLVRLVRRPDLPELVVRPPWYYVKVPVSYTHLTLP